MTTSLVCNFSCKPVHPRCKGPRRALTKYKTLIQSQLRKAGIR